MTYFLVIGCGLPRTGTSSTKEALEILLPGKCCHMFNASRQQREWINLLEDNMTDDEFRNFFKTNQFVAGIDLPFICVYKRAMKLFPDAKCVLTIREPETWVRSMESTLCRVTSMSKQFPYYFFSYFKSFNKFLMTPPAFVTDPKIRGMDCLRDMVNEIHNNRGVDYYNQWLEDVKESVPEERLLVFSVKEGWEPLCQFLNVPIPEQSFPFVNQTGRITHMMTLRENRSWMLLYEMLSLPAIISALYFWTRK